ncbi:SDR family oxidoreductase [Paenibacillus pinistramenti]|uniref:SDR family oxidoreductase n=1 Tax=Paenibacillus pinistramenti TaxID=1768003 RepID=UPI001109B0D1|nr:SDR family oxidoreductase [Paenibacillus pinistramenti]
MRRGILVTGATGNIGLYAAKWLQEKGRVVKAAVTRPERAKAIIGPGIEAVRFDFLNPETYRDALAGTDRILLIRPPALNKPEQLYPFIDAARSEGILHIVFVSLLGAERNPFPPHHRIEKYIRQSGIGYTFLRPSFFMQNLTGPHRMDIKEHSDILIPAGHAKVSFIDTRDIGEAAARILIEPERHNGRSYSLTGPEALTYSDAAHIFSEVLGRRITYSNPSLSKFRKAMLSRGLPKGYVNVMAVLYLTTRFGMASRVTTELEGLLGRPPVQLAQFAADYLEEWS